MPLKKGSTVISMLFHTDPERGTIRPGDIGKYVRASTEDPRKDIIRWANFSANLSTFRTQFHPENQPAPSLPPPYAIGDAVVYVGDTQRFSARTSLVKGDEGTLLGPSIDESDSLMAKPGAASAALTLKKNHSVSVMFAQNQKAVNVRTSNLKPLGQPDPAAAVVYATPPGVQPGGAAPQFIYMSGTAPPETESGHEYVNVTIGATSTPSAPPDTGSAVYGQVYSPKGQAQETSASYTQIIPLNAIKRSSGPIHVREEGLYDGVDSIILDDEPAAVTVAAGSLQCAYVGGGSRACKHRNMEGSQQCDGHTCGAPGCGKPKSSSDSVCTSCDTQVQQTRAALLRTKEEVNKDDL